ncbi:MAG: SOS response-associated peptidase [Bacteroidia bacterium]|nr:SOS response-associated peptidase [Bacteroidia bacterium]
MCYHYKITKKVIKIEERFKAIMSVEDKELFEEKTHINGYNHPWLPAISNKEPHLLHLMSWGLIPFWAKDNKIANSTLNAKIETVHQLPSFKNVVNNRCLIPADGFFEWKHLDEKGKNKQCYSIGLENQELFSFAGLYSKWKNPENGREIFTYTILTTEANTLMSEIHNVGLRMPVILKQQEENNYLNGMDLNELSNREDIKLSATPIDSPLKR